MIKYIVLGAILINVFLGCTPDKKDMPGWDIVISGKVGFPKEGDITIKNWVDTTDTFQVLDFDRTNYTYKGTVRVLEPGYYRISFFDAQFVDVVLYKNDIEINADGNSQGGFYEILGSKDVELFENIEDVRSEFQHSPELAKLNEDFSKAVNAKDEKSIAALRLYYQKILKSPNDSIAQLLVRFSPSVAVIEFLSKRELDPDEYFNVYEKVNESLKGEWESYRIGKEFIELVNKMRTVAIGSIAPDLALPDPSGNVISLSSFRGKYVLVDFWAKWCGPCRDENPNVLMAYNKFKDKGFEIYGVSLDRNKKDWLQAIAEDGLTWTQVSDLKYFNSEAARIYNINAIPFSILLDPNGVIIAKNLRGSALDSKLEEIF